MERLAMRWSERLAVACVVSLAFVGFSRARGDDRKLSYEDVLHLYKARISKLTGVKAVSDKPEGPDEALRIEVSDEDAAARLGAFLRDTIGGHPVEYAVAGKVLRRNAENKPAEKKPAFKEMLDAYGDEFTNQRGVTGLSGAPTSEGHFRIYVDSGRTRRRFKGFVRDALWGYPVDYALLGRVVIEGAEAPATAYELWGPLGVGTLVETEVVTEPQKGQGKTTVREVLTLVAKGEESLTLKTERTEIDKNGKKTTTTDQKEWSLDESARRWVGHIDGTEGGVGGVAVDGEIETVEEKIAVPAGMFDCTRYRATLKDGSKVEQWASGDVPFLVRSWKTTKAAVTKTQLLRFEKKADPEEKD
jgi:hypothetical protein